MNKKTLITNIIIIILVIIISTALIIYWPTEESAIKYSENPKDWVQKAPTRGYNVNFTLATDNKGYYNQNNQQMRVGANEFALEYSGMYQGVNYNTQYLDAKGIRAEITPKLVPDDGILQGIIVERYEEGKLIAHVFLDSDWKKIGPLKIIVDKKEKAFSGQEIQPGIYHDTVVDDRDRNGPIILGQVLVGNMQSYDEVRNSTFIRII